MKERVSPKARKASPWA